MILFFGVLTLGATALVLAGLAMMLAPGYPMRVSEPIAPLLFVALAWLMLFLNYSAWRSARKRGWAIGCKDFLLYWGPTVARASKLDPEDLRDTPAFAGLTDLEILNRAELMLERNALSRLKEDKRKDEGNSS